MTIVLPIYLYNNSSSVIKLDQINKDIQPYTYFSIKNEKELFDIYLTSKNFESNLANGDLVLTKDNLLPIPTNVYTPTEAISIFSIYRFITTVSITPSSFSFTSSLSESVNHNFGRFPSIQVVDDLGELIIPSDVIHDDLNNFTINFAISTSGTIIYT